MAKSAERIPRSSTASQPSIIERHEEPLVPRERLTLTPNEERAAKDFWEVYDTHYDLISQEIVNAIVKHPEFGPVLQRMPSEKLAEQNRRSRDQMRRALLDNEWEPYLTELRVQGASYANSGVSFTGWFEVVGIFRILVTPHLLTAYGKMPDRLLSAVNAMNKIVDIAMAVIGQEYLKTKEGIISQQQQVLGELSTPVLQVRDRQLILPIIGVIDSQRARQLTEQLLRSIRANRAKVVVIDITGVPAVDSKVANHIVQTVDASRLMGATVIVTGLSAEVAQTLVTLGVDLTKLNTVADLQGGIEEADRILGYKLIHVNHNGTQA